MDQKLKYFLYSQNSLNTFKSCPLKFKYKYIDNINWRLDSIESRDYYEGLKSGSEFHLLCERYFKNIPIGENISEEFKLWIEKIKDIIYIDESKIYLPEYEVRIKIGENYLTAKYDLVIIDDNSIEIWDWKTESQNSSYKNIENRMQTIVYMYLAKEVIQKIYNLNIDTENISMKYFRLKIDNYPITVKYNKEKHLKSKYIIESFINNISNLDFDGYIQKNKNHCKYCEFNKLCNNKNINYDIIDENIDFDEMIEEDD